MLRLQPDRFVDPTTDPGDFTREVALVVHDGVELLDFAGPGEVFQVAGGFGADRGRPAFRVRTVAPTLDPVVSQGFLTLEPEDDVESAPRPDVVVVPGGATAVLLRDRRFVEWLTRTTREAELCMSVCTGALALGAIGALDGLEATTWHGFLDRLARRAPSARVVAGRRWVDAGRIVTTAGVSAGIDGALHVVARLVGRRVARRTAEYMEYRWSPDPGIASAYPWLAVDLDDNSRAVRLAEDRLDGGEVDEATEALRRVVAAEPDHGEAWFRLAHARFRSDDPQGAIDALTAAARTRPWRAAALHDRACVRARSGDLDGAIHDLLTLADEGALDPEAVVDDPDLAAVVHDVRLAPSLSGSRPGQAGSESTNRLPPPGRSS